MCLSTDLLNAPREMGQVELAHLGIDACLHANSSASGKVTKPTTQVKINTPGRLQVSHDEHWCPFLKSSPEWLC